MVEERACLLQRVEGTAYTVVGKPRAGVTFTGSLVTCSPAFQTVPEAGDKAF